MSRELGENKTIEKAASVAGWAGEHPVHRGRQPENACKIRNTAMSSGLAVKPEGFFESPALCPIQSDLNALRDAATDKIRRHSPARVSA
jgi:hypothetical protein